MFPIGNNVKEYLNMNNSELVIEIRDIDTEKLSSNPQIFVDNIDFVNFHKLQQYVLDSLNNLDGGPSISHLEVTNLKSNIEDNVGSLRLKFQIDRRYCCSDIESCSNDYLDFNFKIEQDKLIAKSEYFDWNINN